MANNTRKWWHDEAVRLYTQDGLSYSDIVKELETLAPLNDPDGELPGYNTVKSYIYSRARDFIKAKRELKAIERQERDKQIQESIDNAEKGGPVFENYIPTVTDVDWKGNRVVRFAIVSDTHMGSKYEQLSYLNEFYDICEHEGIKHVYHAGDITEGIMMRPGHINECHKNSANELEQWVIDNYPRRDSITTHFITGNHDSSTMKHCGHNMGPTIAANRDDMEYLGTDCAVINLTPNCTLELRHPWDGGSYAMSYRPQKMVEAMDGGSKPNILVIGHYHKMGYFFYRNVHCYLPGCFQSQTPFSRGKGLAVHMGAWILEVHVDEKGSITEIIDKKFVKYEGLKDDYKKYE